MTNGSAPARAPDFACLHALQARLDAARAAHTDLSDAEIDEVLRVVVGKRAILAGKFRGRAAIFRLVEPQDKEALGREWRELKRIWPHMNSGSQRVAEPLHFCPEAGLMVVGRVEGVPLLEHLWKSTPEMRSAHLRHAAEWLRHYSEGTESWQAGNAAGWLARAARGTRTQPAGPLRQIKKDILTSLRTLSARLSSEEWRVAICHGDFHPNNLILGTSCLTGIDLGGSARLPVLRAIARFLVHMGRRGMIPSGHRHLGVDARGIEVFAEVFDMTECERSLWVPFFIGVEALIRVESEGLKKERISQAEDMCIALRDDLVRIPS